MNSRKSHKIFVRCNFETLVWINLEFALEGYLGNLKKSIRKSINLLDLSISVLMRNTNLLTALSAAHYSVYKKLNDFSINNDEENYRWI